MPGILAGIRANRRNQSQTPKRKSQPADLAFAPTFIPDVRLAIHNLRRGGGIIGAIFSWGSLIVFLALGSYPVTTALGAALGVSVALLLLTYCGLCKWEMYIPVLSLVFIFIYLIQYLLAHNDQFVFYN